MEDDAAPGVPEWVVTYGDMMSLLLTFFIMLVSLSEVVADQKYRAILDALHKYMGYRAAVIAPRGKSFPLNSLISNLDTLGSWVDDDKGRGGVKHRAIDGEDVRVFRNREGGPLRMGTPILFAPGDAVLSPEAKASLHEIAEKLAGKPNKIEIRAQSPYKPDDASSDVEQEYRAKLQLSYQRARNVLNDLEREGITHDRLRLTAVAVPEDSNGGGDWLARHLDRAEVLILDAFAADFIGPREAPR